MSSKSTRAVFSLGLLGLGIALVLAFAAAPAEANVYASDLRFSAPAVDATQPNPSVQLSFRLNEPADQEVRIDIFRADTNQLVRTANLGALPRGLNSYSWNLRNNANALVATNVPYYFKVYARTSGYGSWTQISDDNEQNVKYYYPRSVDVNTDPASPYFGWIYVNNSLGGTTTAPAEPQRTLGVGLYAMKADVSDATGQGDTARDGGAGFTTSNVSPYHIKVGPAGKVYSFDWTDPHGGVWVAPPDLGGTWPALLSPDDVVNSAGVFSDGVAAPPAIHGSISTGIVEGKGLNRVLYTVDEDIYPAGSRPVHSKGSIFAYPIGPLDQTYKQSPTVVWNDDQPNIITNWNNDLVRDSQGNWWLAQYRSNGTDVSSLLKIAPDGNAANNYAPLWGSLSAWGSPDPLRNNAAGVDIYEPAMRFAAAATFAGVVNVFKLDQNYVPVQSTLTSVGGGALVFVGGASSTLLYSSNGTATNQTFTARTAPTPGVLLNDISITNAGSTSPNGFAVGSGGNIFKETNNAAAWTAEPSPVTTDLNAVSAIWNAVGGEGAVLHGWAVGAGGTILGNTTGSWVQDSSPVSVDLNGITRRISSYAGPAYDLYVVGDNGTIIRRLDASNTDTPTTWEVQTSGTTRNLNDISALVFAIGFGSTTAYVSGDNGTILKTTDGGVTWTAQTSGTTANLNGIYAVTGLNAWAVGDNGTILATIDGGATWTAQASGTTAKLNSVEFRDNQTGWVVGDGGLVLRTRDGGQTWQTVTSGTGNNLTGISAVPTGSGTPRDVAFDAVGNLYTVDNANELLRIYSPPDGVNEYTTTSAQQFVPTSGSAAQPAAPDVTAPAVSNTTNTLSASWTATGAAYRYAIGVTAEDQGEYVVPWTNTNNTNVNLTNLSLQNGITYFWYVQARSANNVWSDVGVSDGTLVQAPNTIGEAVKLPDGAPVNIQDIVVTKVNFTNDFWAQEQDRSAGIRVVYDGSLPSENTLVTIVGTMGTDGPERIVNAESVTVGNAYTPEPLGVNNQSIGGAAVDGGIGLTNAGLLVTVWGEVTAIDFGASAFYLDDGSNVENDTPTDFVFNEVPGLKVVTPATLPFNVGSYYMATGIVRLEEVDGQIIRRLDLRSDLDLVLINP